MDWELISSWKIQAIKRQQDAVHARHSMSSLLKRKEVAAVKTILVVEDDADIGDFIVQVLTQETPHHPILVADGKQALEITRKLIPDLFIIDYLLPHMNGIEHYDILQSRKELAAIPTIIISAHLPRQEI